MNHSPYIPWPPTEVPVIKEDNTIADEWKNHMDSITQNIGYVVSHDRFNDTKQETPIITVIGMSAARRAQLQNAVNGSIIYNTDTNVFNFRQGGAWVTFTPVPA